MKNYSQKNNSYGLEEAVSVLDSHVENASKGLPDEVFYFVSRMTPLVNVDLLIKDTKGRTLLAWRDDAFVGKGWHVPGGIVRYKETFEKRVLKVAESELGADIRFDSEPVAVNQLIHHHKNRGHFISILYRCSLPDVIEPENKGRNPFDVGYLKWHDSCPHNLISCHDIYRSFI